MAILHFIGVGGTGHKTLTALIHIAACGAFKGQLGTHKIDEIRVMTLDADISNGNLSQTRNTLEAYQRFTASLAGGNFGFVPIKPVSEKVNLSLYDGNRSSISKAFSIAQYEESDEKHLINFLFASGEINAEFNEGFYGHTSIGTLIVEGIINDDKMWNDFLSGVNENDFVFLAGSIFGGTGASAIPVLLEKLNRKKSTTPFNLAVLMLTPYFRAIGDPKEEGELQPKSEMFQIKAKASLYYYHAQKQYDKTDALYIIGEPQVNFSNEVASRGASAQRNKAHPIELFAVTAVLDFIKEQHNRKNSSGLMKVITAERDQDSGDGGEYFYTWNMLKKAHQYLPVDIQNFMKVAIFFNKVVYHDISETGAGLWMDNYKELKTKRDSSGNLLYENIYNYLRLFVDWMYDLHKRNLDQIDVANGVMKYEAEPKMRLFSRHGNLFDNKKVSGAAIENYETLVFNESYGKKPEKIYNDLHIPPKGTDGDFAALFTLLFEIVKTPEKKPLFAKRTTPVPESYKSVPYLSKENDVTFLKPDADPNKLWAVSQADLLKDIADGLPSNMGKSFRKDDVSIPSPWSIYIMNELALSEPKFSALNKDAYNQWCGLIALLALRKINLYENYGLELKRLSIPASGDDFVEAIKDNCLPGTYIFDNQHWTQSCRISLGGKTIAFLANNTILCPAYSYDAITKTGLNKMAPSIVDENGQFLSPNNYFKDTSQTLNRNSKYALSLFLNELKSIITSVAAVNKNAIVSVLQKLLDRYLDELGKPTVNPEISIDPNIKNQVSSVLDVFERMLPVSNSRNIDLPFILDETLGGQATALIGLNICGISSTSPRASHTFVTEKLLYGQINPESIGIYKNQIQDGVRLLYEEELLCDSMVIVRKENNAVFHTRKNNSSLNDFEIIWPISGDLLELYPVETLNGMVRAEMAQEEITVTLRLRLKGGNHTVSKKYRMLNMDAAGTAHSTMGICVVFEKNRLPFWGVWPYTKILNSREENIWKSYNFFCVDPVYTNTPVFGIEPYFEQKNGKLLGEQKLSTVSTAIDDINYRRYDSLPDAFKFREKPYSDLEGYRGVVFLNPPKTVRQGAIEWNIGLDFGTTSTTAFYTTNQGTTPQFIQLFSEYKWKAGSERPEEYSLDNSLCVLCDAGSSNSKRNWETYFIDKQCLKQNGWTTTYEIMDTTVNNDAPVIFETGRIFWHNHENFKIMNTIECRRDRLLTNIKWETKKANAGKYLNQLLTQIIYRAAEQGVQKINWYFSYPTAFGLGDQSEFSSTLDRLVKDLEADTGVKSIFNRQNNLLTESIAAAYYFRDKHPREQFFLCVDIGGGTSDISVWFDNKYVFQSSVHFASRAMFIEPLRKLLERKGVMDKVRTDRIEDGIHTMLKYGGTGSQLSDDKIKFFIETVLFEYYDDFTIRLNALEGNDQKAYKNFKYCILIAYSGLVFYLAAIISELLLTDDPKKKIDNDMTNIVFGLSGKGAKLTDWIDIYCPIIYQEAEALIAEKSRLSLEFKGHTHQFNSIDAKTETAIGMICNLDGAGEQRDTTEKAKPDVYMGSAVTVKLGNNEKYFDKNNFVDIYSDPFFADCQKLSVEIDQNLSELDEFINFFNRVAAQTRGDIPVISLETYEKKKKALWNQIKKEFSNVLKEGRFSPPFIVMLSVFLQEFCDENK